ncbi:MAG TPA: 2-succinyl-5-enolpyruvyl-6-hydroxy-3-cyclohexene-1-carboxylic-acid synthase [Thermoleophilaceae bacterium]
MIPINRTYAPVQALVDELARCGMRHAVTSPGSRNAPIALTLAADERIEAHSVLDERSAGFVALGIAKATGTPVAVTCTSGSAAANLMPAIVEAREARVPLIALTADRPPELRDVGAGQAIDQLELYGSAVKWFVEVGSHEPSRETAVHHRALACRAFWTAATGRPGPVHVNLPLRDPLAPVREELDERDWLGRPGGEPWARVEEGGPQLAAAQLEDLGIRVAAAERGAIVCGTVRGEPPLGAAELAAAAGWPLLAEPTSGLRLGPHDRSHVVAHYDVLLRLDRFAAEHQPDLVIRIGDTPTSKPLRRWLALADQVVVDPDLAWHEPTRAAHAFVRANPDELCARLAEAPRPADGAWLDGWLGADALVPPQLAATADPFEPKVWTAAAGAAPEGAVLWVASSMPIRDVEAFLPSDGKRLRVLANRGANGIDGTTSSALGAALSGGGSTVLLTGDLALLHDLGGLMAARRLGAELTIVCASNGGGGIFDHLPVAESADPAMYERHIVTPSGIDLERVAALVELPHVRADDPDAVREAIGRPALVEAPTDRARNVEMHRDLCQRVEAQLPP